MGGLALKNGKIITGYEKDGIIEGVVVLVDSDSGNIERIGDQKETAIPAGYRVIDLADRYLMPGLINAHAHLIAGGKPSIGDNPFTRGMLKLMKSRPGGALGKMMIRKNIKRAVNAGVTTIRSMGDPLYLDIAVRDSLERSGQILPRLLVSGKLICASGGHGEMLTPLIADSPKEARRAVRLNDAACVDHIKLISTGGVTDARKIGDAGRVHMTVEEISAVCDEAHRRGLMVGAHAESTRGVREALLGGVDTIEHGADFDNEIIELFTNNPKSLRGFTAYIPTLSAPERIMANKEKLTDWDDVKFSNAELVLEGQKLGVKKALASGVKVGIGTDSGVPFVTHYDVWRELKLFCEVGGITASRALETATVATAEAIGIDGYTGSLEEGKSADMIVLESNPLEDLDVLAGPAMVIAAGRLIEKPRVDKIRF